MPIVDEFNKTVKENNKTYSGKDYYYKSVKDMNNSELRTNSNKIVNEYESIKSNVYKETGVSFT